MEKEADSKERKTKLKNSKERKELPFVVNAIKEIIQKKKRKRQYKRIEG